MIPIAELERHVGVSSGTDTLLLIELEASAVTFLEHQTQRSFQAAAARTDVLCGAGGVRLWLPEVVESGTPTVLEQAYPGGAQTTITAAAVDGFEVRTGIDVRGPSHLARKGGGTWITDYEYLVTYTAGYTQTAAAVLNTTPEDLATPADIRALVRDLVRYKRAETSSGAAGPLQSERIGDYAYTLADLDGAAAMSGLNHIATLNSWKRLRI